MAIHFLNSTLQKVLKQVSNKWKPDGPWRLPSEAYTLEHKLAFLEREHYLTGQTSLSGWLHDCDKLVMYLLPGLDEKKIQTWHRKHQPHHVSYPQSRVQQLLQTYIDWDCAVLTKPDKPLDAYATLLHFYRNKLPLMLPVCLAINPNTVQPEIADLDKARQNGYDAYLFGEKMNEDTCHDLHKYSSELLNDELTIDAKNDVAYIHTQRLIQSIEKELDAISADIAENNIALDDVLHKIPQNLNLMKPAQIFLKTLEILARKRNQKIDLPSCCKVLKEKNLRFLQMAPKFRIDGRKCNFVHNYCTVMANPFLKD